MGYDLTEEERETGSHVHVTKNVLIIFPILHSRNKLDAEIVTLHDIVQNNTILVHSSLYPTL